MTDVDKTSTAHRLTVPTPNGPFTVIHLDGAVLASGWTDDPGYLTALIHPRLRPATLTAGVGDRTPIIEAVTAYHDGDTAAVEEIAVAHSSRRWPARASASGCWLHWQDTRASPPRRPTSM